MFCYGLSLGVDRPSQPMAVIRLKTSMNIYKHKFILYKHMADFILIMGLISRGFRPFLYFDACGT
jgi:hypothetical protein